MRTRNKIPRALNLSLHGWFFVQLVDFDGVENTMFAREVVHIAVAVS
jgi:hypothetical protein